MASERSKRRSLLALIFNLWMQWISYRSESPWHSLGPSVGRSVISCKLVDVICFFGRFLRWRRLNVTAWSCAESCIEGRGFQTTSTGNYSVVCHTSHTTAWWRLVSVTVAPHGVFMCAIYNNWKASASQYGRVNFRFCTNRLKNTTWFTFMWIECNKYFFIPLCFLSSVQIPIIKLSLIRMRITNIVHVSRSFSIYFRI